jgi:hypothetical protein
MLKIITRKNTRNKLLNYISTLMIEVNKLVILKYYKDLESDRYLQKHLRMILLLLLIKKVKNSSLEN